MIRRYVRGSRSANAFERTTETQLTTPACRATLEARRVRSTAITVSTFSRTPMRIFLAKSASTFIRFVLPPENCGAKAPRRETSSISICGTTTLNEFEWTPMPRDEGGPVFSEPWQAQAFALAVRLSEQGYFTWKEWAATLA